MSVMCDVMNCSVGGYKLVYPTRQTNENLLRLDLFHILKTIVFFFRFFQIFENHQQLMLKSNVLLSEHFKPDTVELTSSCERTFFHFVEA